MIVSRPLYQTMIVGPTAHALGRPGCYLVLGTHDDLIACCATYGEALDVICRLAAANLRWRHSAKLYRLRRFRCDLTRQARIERRAMGLGGAA